MTSTERAAQLLAATILVCPHEYRTMQVECERCLTAAFEEVRREARNAALEEAAVECEERCNVLCATQNGLHENEEWTDAVRYGTYAAEARQCAMALRALQEKPTNG